MQFNIIIVSFYKIQSNINYMILNIYLSIYIYLEFSNSIDLLYLYRFIFEKYFLICRFIFIWYLEFLNISSWFFNTIIHLFVFIICMYITCKIYAELLPFKMQFII